MTLFTILRHISFEKSAKIGKLTLFCFSKIGWFVRGGKVPDETAEEAKSRVGLNHSEMRYLKPFLSNFVRIHQN